MAKDPDAEPLASSLQVPKRMAGRKQPSSAATNSNSNVDRRPADTSVDEDAIADTSTRSRSPSISQHAASSSLLPQKQSIANEGTRYPDTDVEASGDSNGNHHVQDRLLQSTIGEAILTPSSTVTHPFTTDAITTNAEETATSSLLHSFANTPKESRTRLPNSATNPPETPTPGSPETRRASSLSQSFRPRMPPGTATFPTPSTPSKDQQTVLQSLLIPSASKDVQWEYEPRIATQLEQGIPKKTLLEWLEREQKVWPGTPSMDALIQRFSYLNQPGQVTKDQLHDIWNHISHVQSKRQKQAKNGKGGVTGGGSKEDEANDESDERRAIASSSKRGPSRRTGATNVDGLSGRKRRRYGSQVRSTPNDPDVVLVGTKDFTDPTPDGTGEDREGRVRKDEAIKDGVHMHEAEVVVDKGLEIDLDKPDRDDIRLVLSPHVEQEERDRH
ncbi:hypothetical protein ACHAP5_005147 [Fusarium lateritium]